MKALTLVAGMMFSFTCLAQGAWVTQNSGTNTTLNAVFFVDSLWGWAVGGTFNADSGIILGTKDGGQTWLTLYTDTQSVFQGVWFNSQQTGWVVGGKNHYTPGDTSGQTILKTTDGGLTWRQQWNRNGNTNWQPIFGVCFIGDMGWACLEGWEDSVAYVIKTTDGGASWGNQPVPDAASDIFDIQFLDTLNGVCCGEWNWGYPADNCDGVIWYTRNGGTTWTVGDTWRPGKTACGLFIKICMVAPRRGWSVGGVWLGKPPYEPGRVVTTNNGGSSWGLCNPSPLQPFVGVYFPDTSWGWIGTSSGAILLTTDGGSNWQDDNSGTGSVILDICGLSRGDAWAVTYSGAILRYAPQTGIGLGNLQNGKLSQLRVFPDPFTSYAKIPGHEAERFALYDISGRLVGTCQGDRIGEGLTVGVYFLKPEIGDARPLRVVKVR
jgi:photosystem II stability/assembly factor-like uncharacterized protein